jgi:hypothetical protein
MPNADEWDHPDSAYLASVVVSEYGAVLDQAAIFTLGASEKRLPYCDFSSHRTHPFSNQLTQGAHPILSF